MITSRFWWCYAGDQIERPFLIALTRAETPQDACATFGESWPATCVHELTSPGVLADPAVAALEPAGLAMAYVGLLPSAYDRFRRPGRSGLDYDAMEDLGFDVF